MDSPRYKKKYSEVLLGMTRNGKRLIRSVELTPRKEKLVLIVEKEEMTYITGWLELINKGMFDKVADPVEWKKLTGSEKRISLWGVESTPEQMKYAQDLMETTKGAVAEGMERNLQQPPRKRYSAGGMKVEANRRPTQNVWVQSINHKKDSERATGNKEIKGTQESREVKSLKEEIESMRQSSMAAIKAMEAKVKETEETVQLIMRYNRQFREENNARDNHMQGIQDTVDRMNDGMLEVREDVDVMSQEQKLQQIRIITIERALKKMKVLVEEEDPPTAWDDGLDDGMEESEGEMESSEDEMGDIKGRNDGPRVKKVKTEGETGAIADTNKIVTPPAVRYSLRGGVNK